MPRSKPPRPVSSTSTSSSCALQVQFVEENKDQSTLYSLLLTQQAVNQKMPYDLIEKVIQTCLADIEKLVVNARIANLALNINGSLVIAQIYVERQNGFVATQQNKFGTTPTAYRVQVRFPFGLQTRLGHRPVTVPAGDFNHVLKPYINYGKVSDDVQRDYLPDDIIVDEERPNLTKQKNGDVLTLSTTDGNSQITFNFSTEIGKGYEQISESKIYYTIDDYNHRLKIAGVYPLFYSSPNEDTLLKTHTSYQGFTEIEKSTVYESCNDDKDKSRIQEYRGFLHTMEQQLIASPTGQQWQEFSAKKNQPSFCFDIEIINGVKLNKQSGLPLIRLRDYQLELFEQCCLFLQSIDDTQSQSNQHKNLTATIDMGVGAGKTFFTFTLLQHVIYRMKDSENIAPPFCLAPNESVASVTEKSINRQGMETGLHANTICDPHQMPTPQFMGIYNKIAVEAQKNANWLNEFLNTGLQDRMLNFCCQQSFHPYAAINFLYEQYNGGPLIDRRTQFKDTIDSKRLLLMIEGQKTIRSKTGRLGINSLKNLIEQFTLLKENIDEEIKLIEKFPEMSRARQKELLRIRELHPAWNMELVKEEIKRWEEKNSFTRPKELFDDIKKSKLDENLLSKLIAHNYNVEVAVPISCRRDRDIPETFNIAKINKNQLENLLYSKNQGNLIAIRDALIAIVAYDEQEAAILLANSGGLGNTHTPEELVQQINRYLPMAAGQIQQFANTPTMTLAGHYRFYLSLTQIFSTVPVNIHFNNILRINFIDKPLAISTLYLGNLKVHVELIQYILGCLGKTLESLNKIHNVLDEKELSLLNLPPETTVIEAANHLAGLASLRITGWARGDDAKLLSSHIPVFTPEGLAAYVESLCNLENQPKWSFVEEQGVYTPEQQGKVSKQDIGQRLHQLFNALMIADEIHKEEFRCLYDEQNPIYQRINTVIKKYFNVELKDKLPPRIGMSGTINTIAENAFGKTKLYSLSIQQMIQQDLVKQVSVEQTPVSAILFDQPNSDTIKRAYAEQIVIDYFVQNTEISLINILEGDPRKVAIDLFALSKGIIFTKTNDAELNEYIQRLFQLIVAMKPSQKQVNLLAKINQNRYARGEALQRKIRGEIPLTTQEKQQFERYRQDLRKKQPQVALSEEGCLLGLNQFIINTCELNSAVLREMQYKSWQNNIFAIYLEFILSKTPVAKELSDIVGLQNRLYEKGFALLDLNIIQKDDEVAGILKAINNVDPRSITREEISRFLVNRLPVDTVRDSLINIIMQHKNNVANAANAIRQQLNNEAYNLTWLTDDRKCFESGMSMTLIGTENERTGYSHEPVGIVIDTPALCIKKIDDILPQLRSQNFTPELVSKLYCALQELNDETFSYDEKNQMGGRALRTPYGHVKYIEYHSQLSEKIREYPSLAALQIEVSFSEIFTHDENLAQTIRRSVAFNRTILSLLRQEFAHYNDFYALVEQQFREELTAAATNAQHHRYMIERLPLLWAMKYHPNIVAAYFQGNLSNAFELTNDMLIGKQVINRKTSPEVSPFWEKRDHSPNHANGRRLSSAEDSSGKEPFSSRPRSHSFPTASPRAIEPDHTGSNQSNPHSPSLSEQRDSPPMMAVITPSSQSLSPNPLPSPAAMALLPSPVQQQRQKLQSASSQQKQSSSFHKRKNVFLSMFLSMFAASGVLLLSSGIFDALAKLLNFAPTIIHSVPYFAIILAIGGLTVLTGGMLLINFIHTVYTHSPQPATTPLTQSVIMPLTPPQQPNKPSDMTSNFDVTSTQDSRTAAIPSMSFSGNF